MVDTLVRNFFNENLKSFFEPLSEGALELSLTNGLVLRDLVVRPKGINDQLAKSGVDARVAAGRVGQMRLIYSAVSGQLSMQLEDVNMLLTPNAIKTFGRFLVQGINQLITQPCRARKRMPRRVPPIYHSPQDYYQYPYQRYPSDDLTDDGAAVCCFGTSPSRRPARRARSLYRPPQRGPVYHAAYADSKGRSTSFETVVLNEFDPECPDCRREAQMINARSIPKVHPVQRRLPKCDPRRDPGITLQHLPAQRYRQPPQPPPLHIPTS